MDLEAFEKLAAATYKANSESEYRLVIAADFGINGDDPNGRHQEALIARLEGNIARRNRALDDAACRVVTGQGWQAWCHSLGDGPAAGYRPSIDGHQFGLAAKVMADAWHVRFGSEAYVYGLDKIVTDETEENDADAPTFRH